jgi:putative spermidine/putrescine transport system permease protein
MSRRSGRTRQPVSAFTLAVTIFLLLPLVVVVFTSFTPGAYALFPPDGFSLKWFSSALDNAQFQSSFYFSLRIAAVTVVVGLVIAIPAAVAITRGSPTLRRLASVASSAPLVIPEILLALGLLILVNGWLPIGTGFLAIVAGHILIGLPLAVQVTVAGLASHDSNLEHAAWTLGASKLHAFAFVTLPAILPAIASAAIFLFIFSFDNISISLFLSSPGNTTLPIQMYEYLQYSADPTVAAMSTILVLIGAVAAVLLGRLGGLQQIAGGRRNRT